MDTLPPQRRMKHKEYKTVSLGEDPEDPRSSTEVDHDESNIDDGSGCREHPNRNGRKAPAGKRVCVSILEILEYLRQTTFQFSVLLLLALIIRKQGEAPSVQLQVGSDHKSRDPYRQSLHYSSKTPQTDHRPVPTSIIKWNASPAFVPNNTLDFFSPSTLAKWNSLLPCTPALPLHPAPILPKLTPPANAARPITTETFSTTSMTHQLHCLFMMGRIYAGVTHSVTDRLPADYHAHFLHCIDYLRQGVMCAGDLAVEPHGEEDADDLGPMDGGWGGLHVCKVYGGVLGVLEGDIKEGRRVVLAIDD